MAGGKNDTRSREDRRKETGEDFTPDFLVQEMLDKLPPESWSNKDKTFLDPECGDGNFLVAVKQRLLDAGHSEENALSRIYGVDLIHDNVVEACRRMGVEHNPDAECAVSRTIVCADTLQHGSQDKLNDLFQTAEDMFDTPTDNLAELKSAVLRIKGCMRNMPKSQNRTDMLGAYKDVVRLIKAL